MPAGERVSAVDLIVRRLGRPDADELGAFFVSNDQPDVRRTFNPFALTRATALSLLEEGRKDRFYGGFVGEAWAAFAMLRGWDEGFDVPSLGILVDRRWRGRGLGGRITDLAIDEARTLGCRRVRLSVFASNQVALRIYVRKGFVEVSREPVEVLGEGDQRIVMAASLDSPVPPEREA
jgi:RimJ/RimL family protein N-acetyltransferase